MDASAVELGGGLYNGTYRIDAAGCAQPVVLRAELEPARQFRSERELMRNEYATVSWLSVIVPLVPTILAADWSNEMSSSRWILTAVGGAVHPTGDMPPAGDLPGEGITPSRARAGGRSTALGSMPTGLSQSEQVF